MLQTIRDRASGWIAYIIVLLISIPFALWGIHEYMGGDDPLLAAQVNGNEIPLRAFNREFHQQRQYLQAIMGGGLPSQNEMLLKQSVINSMVRQELLAQEVESAGYRVGDKVIYSEISAIPAFSKDGQFDKQRYVQVLQSQRRSEAEFEQGLRQQLRLDHFVDGVRGSAFLTKSSLDDYLRLKNQQRSVTYFVIPADSEKASHEVGEEVIEKYYKSHQERFRTPERLKLSYVELKEANIIEGMEVDQEILEESYRDQADRYLDPEQRRARHILLKVPSSDTDGEDEKLENEVEKRVQELSSELRGGADFASLAQQYSEDKLSAPSGGDLGFIARGDMDPAMENVLFKMDVEQISDPVKTEQGFQIVQLLEIKPARQKSFEEVRDQVELEYKQRIAESQFVEMTERLLTLSYEQPDSLEPVAEALGLIIQQTDWVSRAQGQGIASHTEVRDTAFSEEVLGQGRNSDLIELADGSVVVVRVAEHEAASPKPLEQVRDEIKSIIAKQNAREKAHEDGQQAIDDLRAGKSIETLAQQFDAEVKQSEFIKRDDKQVPAAILRKVFTLNKPQQDKQTMGGVPLASGDFAVIILNAVREAALTDEDKEAIDTQQFVVGYGTREIEATYRTLEQGADIRILQENL